MLIRRTISSGCYTGHFRPLYIKAHVNGKPISRVWINEGAMLNVMLDSTIKKLRKSYKDLKETNMPMSNFTGESTPTLGFLIIELTVGSRTTNTMFFVVNAKPGTLMRAFYTPPAASILEWRLG